MGWIRLVKHPLGTAIFLLYASIVHGVKFRLTPPSRVQDLYRFRFRLYSEEGYIRVQDHPDGMFSDQYDPYSVSVIAEKNGEIVGAGRATHYSEIGLPSLAYFKLDLPADMSPAAMVEMGRFMIDRRYRGKSRVVSIGLSLQLRAHIRENASVKWLIAFMATPVRQAFAELIPFEVLSEGPLEQKHLAARELLPGYWAKGDIHPVVAKASALL